MSEKFGYYKPKNITFLLEFIRKLGISRGTIRRQIQKIWERLGYEVVDASIHSIKYRLNIRENTTDAKILTTSKFYDLKEIDALVCEGDKSQKDKVFIDIGANTGHYSLSLAKRGFRRIIAIEPKTYLNEYGIFKNSKTSLRCLIISVSELEAISASGFDLIKSKKLSAFSKVSFSRSKVSSSSNLLELAVSSKLFMSIALSSLGSLFSRIVESSCIRPSPPHNGQREQLYHHQKVF